MNLFFGICFVASVSSILQYLMESKCPWTMESEQINSLLDSIKALFEQIIEVYLVFLTLVVTIGFAIIYPQPSDKDFRTIFGLTFGKFAIDIFYGLFGHSETGMIKMMFVCCIFDLCMLIVVLCLIGVNLKSLSTTLTHLSRHAN